MTLNTACWASDRKQQQPERWPYRIPRRGPAGGCLVVAVGSRVRPHIGKSIQGWPPVESSLKGAISRHIRKEEMRNGEVSRGRQDSRIRKRKVTATACTCQPSLQDKGTPSPGPSKATTRPAGLTLVAVQVGEGKMKDPSRSQRTRSCADTGKGM